MFKLGLDKLLENKGLLKGKKIGILAHPASVDKKYIHILEHLNQAYPKNLKLLFGPEHGIMGTAQDMEGVSSHPDPLTGVETISLYGTTLESLSPTKEQLAKLDVLICDLQDIGARYYTYIYTLLLCMRVAQQTSTKIYVLDRPNPLGGEFTEGSLLKKGYESFVGLFALPVCHGMTIGELALYFNEVDHINCPLEVISMEGYQRNLRYEKTSAPWVPPSPNMPTLNTAAVYPGMCLIEATEISEGRGTTTPFEYVGAPFIDSYQLAKELNALSLDGVYFRPASFKPMFQKHANKNCYGVFIHVTDHQKLKPYALGLSVIHTIHKLYPESFKWRHKPYEFVDNIPAIDLLTGSSYFRESLENKIDLKTILGNLLPVEHEFIERRRNYLIYK